MSKSWQLGFFTKIRKLGEWKASFLTAATSYLEMTLRDLGSKDVILSLFDFRLDLPRNENSGSAAAKKQTCGKNRVQTQTAKKEGKKSPQQFCRRFPRISCLWRSPAWWTRRQCRASSSPVLLSMLPQVTYLCHNHLLSHCHHFIVTWTTDCHLWHMNEWITTKSETTVNERLVAFSVDLQKRKNYCLTT